MGSYTIQARPKLPRNRTPAISFWHCIHCTRRASCYFRLSILNSTSSQETTITSFHNELAGEEEAFCGFHCCYLAKLKTTGTLQLPHYHRRKRKTPVPARRRLCRTRSSSGRCMNAHRQEGLWAPKSIASRSPPPTATSSSATHSLPSPRTTPAWPLSAS